MYTCLCTAYFLPYAHEASLGINKADHNFRSRSPWSRGITHPLHYVMKMAARYNGHVTGEVSHKLINLWETRRRAVRLLK